MSRNEGGCLCGAVRFATLGEPSRVTVCHCRFCQKATGSAYLVEPIFDADKLVVWERIEARQRDALALTPPAPLP